MGTQGQKKKSQNKKNLIPFGTTVQLEIEGIDQRFNSVFIGSLQNEFLIFKTPVSGHLFSIRTNIFAGIKMVVRFLASGAVYAFEANLIEAITSPEKLIFVSHPENIVRHDLRSRKRVDCGLPAKIKVSEWGYAGVIKDINEQGCQFSATESSHPFPEDLTGNIAVRFLLPGVEKELEIKGSPKNIEREGQNISMGVQFIDSIEEVKRKITDYLTALERATVKE